MRFSSYTLERVTKTSLMLFCPAFNFINFPSSFQVPADFFSFVLKFNVSTGSFGDISNHRSSVTIGSLHRIFLLFQNSQSSVKVFIRNYHVSSPFDSTDDISNVVTSVILKLVNLYEIVQI